MNYGNSDFRVGIVGAGAMGSIVGAALADTGVDITLLDVDPRLVSTLRDGLSITTAEGSRVLRFAATTDPTEIGLVDVVVVLVKGYRTQDAAQLAAPLVGERTVVISLQNGWGNGEVLVRAFGAERVFVGVTYNSATVVEPGCVSQTGAGPTYLGPFGSGDLELADQLAEALSAGGLETHVIAKVGTEIWKKLVLNAATLPTAALTGLTAGALGEQGDPLGTVDEAAREAVAVGRVLGFEVDSEERLGRIHAVLAGAGTGKGSMLQDLEMGRRTEVETINGAVVAAGHKHGVPVPVNETLRALVKGYERAHGLA